MRVALHCASNGAIIHGALRQGLEALGHACTDWRPGVFADLVLLVNVSNHGAHYTYGQLPEHPRLAFVDTAEYGWDTHGDSRYANAFNTASLKHVEKNELEQRRLLRHLGGRSFPYFLREMQLSVRYPSCYHPIDYPMLAPLGPPPDLAQFKARPYDVLVSWGESHHWRVGLNSVLRALRDQDSTALRLALYDHRVPPDVYWDSLYRQTKSTLSFDGYGSGSFRVTEALSRCLLVQGPLQIQQHQPLLDGQTCVYFKATGCQSGPLEWTNLAEVLTETLADVPRCFDIYQRGYQHLIDHFTVDRWAQYVLDVCERHDWRLPTRLDLER